ncbi:hypothetical protein ECAE60S_01731 [Eoetvoesiella caeni]
MQRKYLYNQRVAYQNVLSTLAHFIFQWTRQNTLPAINKLRKAPDYMTILSSVSSAKFSNYDPTRCAMASSDSLPS